MWLQQIVKSEAESKNWTKAQWQAHESLTHDSDQTQIAL